jgi:hypothetical protein
MWRDPAFAANPPNVQCKSMPRDRNGGVRWPGGLRYQIGLSGSAGCNASWNRAKCRPDEGVSSSHLAHNRLSIGSLCGLAVGKGNRWLRSDAHGGPGHLIQSLNLGIAGAPSEGRSARRGTVNCDA